MCVCVCVCVFSQALFDQETPELSCDLAEGDLHGNTEDVRFFSLFVSSFRALKHSVNLLRRVSN